MKAGRKHSFSYKKKIGIVTSGGGIACAYSAGVILALVEKLHLTNPHLVIGSSASTGTLGYYVAGQYASIKNVWENLLSSKKLIHLMRLHKVVDIDYLIDDIFKKQDVMDIKKVKSSTIKFFISVTNSETGGVEYFGNQKNVDIFEALRATIAAPIVCSRLVTIHGYTYIDGAIGGSLSMNIAKAKKEGAEVVLAIDNPSQSFIIDTLFRIYALFKNTSFRNQVKKFFQEEKYQNNDTLVFTIKPTMKLPVSKLDNTREHIIKTMQIGYNDVVRQSASIQRFLLK